jgi:hypothetical protein
LSISVIKITFLSFSVDEVLTAKNPFVLFPDVSTTPAIYKHFAFISFLQKSGKAVCGSQRTAAPIFYMIGL